MKKLFAMLLCLSFVCQTLFLACKNQAKDEIPNKKDSSDPELKLVKLKILDAEVDLGKMEIEVSENEIDIEDITAWFDYGDVKEEAIGVAINGKEVFDVGSAEFMTLSVLEEKSKYKAWSKKVKVISVQKEMSLFVGWDYTNQPSDTDETFDTETVCFSVVAEEDIIQSITLHYDDKDVEMPVQQENIMQKVYWVASRIVCLPTDESKEYKITVKPIDSNKYRDTVVSYTLRGTKTPIDNAEFIYVGENPDVRVGVTWKDNCESTIPQDYGASSINVDCRTLSPSAKVMAKIVNQKNENEIIGQEVELTCADKNGVHTGSINLLQDKPSKVILYVVAEDGSTKDNNRGKWTAIYNPIDLYWSYNADDIATAELRKNKTEEYASIDVVKAQVQNNKIHLVFVTWAQDYGFVPKDMDRYTELDTFGEGEDQQTAYRLDVDVSTLNVGQTKDVVFTVMKNKNVDGEVIDPPVEASSYRVTINMK